MLHGLQCSKHVSEEHIGQIPTYSQNVEIAEVKDVFSRIPTCGSIGKVHYSIQFYITTTIHIFITKDKEVTSVPVLHIVNECPSFSFFLYRNVTFPPSLS